MSRLMDTKKVLVLHRHFFHILSFYFSQNLFKLPINRVVKILTSNWIVQSLHRYVYVSFITMWYNVPRFCAFINYWLLGMRSFFIPQQRIGRDDPDNLPYLLFVTKYDNVSSGDKSRSSVLVPVGSYNSSFLHFAPFSSLSQVFLLLKILSRCILLSERRNVACRW